MVKIAPFSSFFLGQNRDSPEKIGTVGIGTVGRYAFRIVYEIKFHWMKELIKFKKEIFCSWKKPIAKSFSPWMLLLYVEE